METQVETEGAKTNEVTSFSSGSASHRSGHAIWDNDADNDQEDIYPHWEIIRNNTNLCLFEQSFGVDTGRQHLKSYCSDYGLLKKECEIHNSRQL